MERSIDSKLGAELPERLEQSIVHCSSEVISQEANCAMELAAHVGNAVGVYDLIDVVAPLQ